MVLQFVGEYVVAFLYPEFILGSLKTLILADKGFLFCKIVTS